MLLYVFKICSSRDWLSVGTVFFAFPEVVFKYQRDGTIVLIIPLIWVQGSFFISSFLLLAILHTLNPFRLTLVYNVYQSFKKVLEAVEKYIAEYKGTPEKLIKKANYNKHLIFPGF